MYQNIRLLNWFNFFTEFRLYAPFSIIYFSEVSGSFTLGMAVFSAATITSAVMEIPAGIFSDRIGRRRTIISGAVLSLLAVISYAAAPGISILILGGIFEGTARSLFSGNNSALLFDSLQDINEELKYHHYFGRMNSLSHSALAISALLGGLAGFWSFELVLWLSVPPQIIALLISFGINEPKYVNRQHINGYNHLVKSFRHMRGNTRLVWLTIAGAISSGIGEANFQFRAAFFNTLWPLWAIGLLNAIANSIASLSFRMAGKVIDRFKHLKVLILSSIIGQISNFTGILLANILSPLIMTVPSLMYGIGSTAQDHLLQESFTTEQRATLGSIVSLTGSLVYAVAAIVIGMVADSKGVLVAMITLLIIQMLVIPIYIKLIQVK